MQPSTLEWVLRELLSITYVYAQHQVGSGQVFLSGSHSFPKAVRHQELRETGAIAGGIAEQLNSEGPGPSGSSWVGRVCTFSPM